MKLIKKIAAIMLSVMMVLGMASVVSAEEGGATAATGTGKITITNAIAGQTYKIYKLLDLESYDKNKGLYSYKPAAEWKKFFEVGGVGNSYVEINENGYVTWKTGANAATLAQEALAYANNTSTNISNNGSKSVTEGENYVTFDNLALGYYLVDSSVGALCGLTTTDNEVTIIEKNGVPTVEKKVYDGTNYSTSNYANIGDSVTFLINVFVKKGAQNYTVYDKMSDGLKLIESSVSDIPTIHIDSYPDTVKIETTDYTVSIDADKKGFQIVFDNDFLERYKEQEYRIDIAYSATLTGNAGIGKNNPNTNKTWLTYGDNNTKSTESVTNTYTFGIPVFKYTGNDTPLAEAKFTLYSDSDCSTAIELIKAGTGETYRRFITKDNAVNKVTEITTNASGKFNITGLNSGTYYLKEIEAPKGYNKLSAPITVVIDKDGAIKVNDSQDATTEVKVLNNTGTILPTTGGNGTSLIYFLGAVLALVSGVVLITKQRMKNS